MTSKDKHPGGRPPKFKDPAELEALLSDYFENEPVLTMTGLALHLGFVNRQSMYDYEKKPEFSDTIKMARAMIENGYEKALARGEGTAGHIFALKNFGWTDKSQQEISGPGGSAIENQYTVKLVDAGTDDTK